MTNGRKMFSWSFQSRPPISNFSLKYTVKTMCHSLGNDDLQCRGCHFATKCGKGRRTGRRPVVRDVRA